MRTRLSAAKKRPGWVGGQLLRPADKQGGRVIVGTWKSRADWEAWHHDPQFAETRQRLDGLESAPAEHWWHDVLRDVRKTAAPPPPPSLQASRDEGQGEDPPKALGLTIPPAALSRHKMRLNHANHRAQPIPAWLVDPLPAFQNTQLPVVLGRSSGASRDILGQAEAKSADSSSPRPLLRGLRSTMGPRGSSVRSSLGLSLPSGEPSWRSDTAAAAALMAHRGPPRSRGTL